MLFNSISFWNLKKEEKENTVKNNVINLPSSTISHFIIKTIFSTPFTRPFYFSKRNTSQLIEKFLSLITFSKAPVWQLFEYTPSTATILQHLLIDPVGQTSPPRGHLGLSLGKQPYSGPVTARVLPQTLTPWPFLATRRPFFKQLC